MVVAVWGTWEVATSTAGASGNAGADPPPSAPRRSSPLVLSERRGPPPSCAASSLGLPTMPIQVLKGLTVTCVPAGSLLFPA
ncbi:uncharacterized protein isoform X3 [Macaca fascicularis]|uniref:uncharacterized protein isoform X3 n=1 Tax=Macaca fascicularis TaxID=9541 RepID=UPI0032B0319A